MSLQASVQRVRPSARQGFEGKAEPGEMRQRRLQGVKAIVQWQQCMSPEGHDHCFVLFAENCGTRLCWSGLAIFDCLALAPLQNSLRIDPICCAQLFGRSFRSLYRSSDGVRSAWASDRWRPTCLTVALPWRTWPIVLPSILGKGSHYQALGSNTGSLG